MEIITRMYRQQMNHFQSRDCRESIPNRIEQRAQLAASVKMEHIGHR
ncbi:MAG: hypothetical protein PUI52_06180 [Bacteroidales bacterium]|nr:hypothetical protein [Bacteroidales bacterium]MDY4480860.1 hypothetical protein [Candidatus Cryptobacteroides sp.]MDY4562335.1 hypothetical protein [Candidatus Cryptobacteroides sp.]MDY6171179.1 hypothetical protein [Candidatus Cryptobacteroides sp.]